MDEWWIASYFNGSLEQHPVSQMNNFRKNRQSQEFLLVATVIFSIQKRLPVPKLKTSVDAIFPAAHRTNRQTLLKADSVFPVLTDQC